MKEYLTNHLQKIGEFLTKPEHRSYLIKYHQILCTEDPIEIQENNLAQEELLRYGLVFQSQGKLRIYKIYREIFVCKWVEQKLVPQVVDKKIREWIGDDRKFTQIVRELALRKEESITSGKEDDWIQSLFDTYFIENWEINNEQQHRDLQTLRDLLKDKREYLILYRLLLKKDNFYTLKKLDYQSYHRDLLLLGIVQQQQRQFIIPRLYQIVFDINWVERQLVPDEIYNIVDSWTENNPELSRMLFELAFNRPFQLIMGEERKWVEELIKEQILQQWENGHEEIHEHLRNIQREILGHKPKQEIFDILKLYKRVLNEQIVNDNRNLFQDILIQKLKLITVQNNVLRVSNRLYEFVFNQVWINKQEK